MRAIEYIEVSKESEKEAFIVLCNAFKIVFSEAENSEAKTGIAVFSACWAREVGRRITDRTAGYNAMWYLEHPKEAISENCEIILHMPVDAPKIVEGMLEVAKTAFLDPEEFILFYKAYLSYFFTIGVPKSYKNTLNEMLVNGLRDLRE